MTNLGPVSWGGGKMPFNPLIQVDKYVCPILIMHVDVRIDVKTKLYINAPG